jgi:hypothetical protein
MPQTRTPQNDRGGTLFVRARPLAFVFTSIFMGRPIDQFETSVVMFDQRSAAIHPVAGVHV